MTRDHYITLLKKLLNADPRTRTQTIREANQELYHALVQGGDESATMPSREADLALAEVAGG